MGKLLKKLCVQRGHVVCGIACSKNPIENFKIVDTDVVIDFSTPKSAFKNIIYVLDNDVPVVSGTTGWLNQLDEVKKKCRQKNGSFLHSPNFSIGMNLFFNLNCHIAKLIKNLNYQVAVNETHHTEKLDKPSGTAKKLANDLRNELGKNAKISSKRIKNIIGNHTINFNSEQDLIQIKHVAHNREGFAYGAIIAAEWIVNKKGFFSMKDVLKI